VAPLGRSSTPSQVVVYIYEKFDEDILPKLRLYRATPESIVNPIGFEELIFYNNNEESFIFNPEKGWIKKTP